MFHSCIRLLLVQVEQFDIFWGTIPHICMNDSNTRITRPINNSVRNKLVVCRILWLLVKQLPISGHTSTDHFQRSTLKYVEFVLTCSLPTLFLVVIDILSMNVRMDSEPSVIHKKNSLPTLCKLLVFRESSTNSISSLTISTM